MVKFAEQDGISLEVKNFGESGFVNWQNVIRLAELCAEDNIPDFVVFYEGANDVYAKLQTPYLKRVHQNFSEWKWRIENGLHGLFQKWFQKHSLLHMAGRRLGSKVGEHRARETLLSNEQERVQRLAHEVVTTYDENAEFVRKLAKAYGFKAWFFWQPVVYTKDRPTDVERSYKTGFGDLLAAVYRTATEEIRMQDFAIDLSDSFDDQDRTLYIDWAHVIEAGNQIVAKKMYGHIRPTLKTITN